MGLLARSVETAKVAACLSTGWEFLSGERNSFALLGQTLLQGCEAEFSYFMPLAANASTAVGAVGVFIERPTARAVAANMFGEPPDRLHIDSLSDACAEACNVLAACVVLNITDHINITPGLPFRADALVYGQICRTCAPVATYKCHTVGGPLLVIAYEMFSTT
jgi:hypothetical protein